MQKVNRYRSSIAHEVPYLGKTLESEPSNSPFCRATMHQIAPKADFLHKERRLGPDSECSLLVESWLVGDDMPWLKRDVVSKTVRPFMNLDESS